jgi:pimeloyl-ACP methyl ester carboxylesterase
MTGGARALVEQSRPGALVADFRACQAYGRALDAASDAGCPATVVIGRDDKMTPARSGRELAAALPVAHIVELADTGHSMMTENPEMVRRAILDAVRA